MFHLRFHSEASKVSEWEEGRAGVSGSSGRIARDGRDVSRGVRDISGWADSTDRLQMARPIRPLSNH